VAVVVYLILAAILTFGQTLYSAQTLQQAADVAARELSRTPLPADATFDQALQDQNVRSRVFDERYLVLTIDEVQIAIYPPPPTTFNGGHALADFPLVNQQLVPIMIYDQIDGKRVLRYPGAVFTDPNPDPSLIPPASGYLVRVPVVTLSPIFHPDATVATGNTENISWVPVLEEMHSSANANPFQLSSPQRGVVALRINYPYQSAAMSGFQQRPDPSSSPGPGNPLVPIEADDGVAAGSPPGVGSPVASDLEYGPYAGAYGLGRQAAWAKTVRPYRSLISAQAIYRREVFQ
jgi:hypothetical protein